MDNKAGGGCIDAERDGVLVPYQPPKRRRLDSDVDCVLATTVGVDQFSFKWNWNGFASLKNEPEIRSPVIIAGPKTKHSWQLKITPGDTLKFVLILKGFGTGAMDSPNRKISARCQLVFFGRDGGVERVLGKRTEPPLSFGLESELDWVHTLLMTEVEQYVVNNSLKLRCTIWVEGEVKHSQETIGCRSTSAEERREQNNEAFVQEIAKLFNNTDDSDVKISVKQTGSYLNAHSVILKARSPVFAAMFRQVPFKKEVTIEDFDDETVKGMLEWVYTGKTGVLEKRAPDLLQIADKYGLAGLKMDCEHVIADHLTVTNVSQILVLAYVFKALLLKQRATEMILKNKKEVKKTAEFKEVVARYGRTNIFTELYLADIANNK